MTRRLPWVSILIVAAALMAAAIFHRALLAWFAGANGTEPETPAHRHGASGAPADPAPTAADDEIAHYTCPMHPAVRMDGPGSCPLCGMDLTPVTRAAQRSGVVIIEEARRQIIGVKTTRVERKPMSLAVRALGRITYDERKLHDVTLRVSGFIERLFVNETGQQVSRGQPLFTLFSPELYAAQQEYLLARVARGDDHHPLRASTRKRLQLAGLSKTEIMALESRGQPSDAVTLHAPATGFVIEKNLVEGAAVSAGQRLYRIAALDRVWVQADVYERDLPQVKKAKTVTVTLPALPGQRFSGKIDYVYPYLAADSRTGKVRIELGNPSRALKPEMYADVSFRVDAGTRLQVPSTAIIYTGPRRLVFVDLGEGRLRPQEVEIGLEDEASSEIVAGLEEGDVIVSSGNFLVAAESRIRAAVATWGGDEP